MYTNSRTDSLSVFCGSPPFIGNGFIRSITGTTFGETTTYNCHSKYTLSGSATITCQVDGSWEIPPVCLIVEGDCALGMR